MATHDEHIFLSGIRETQSRTNLFRPKELSEVVFPGIGMIMHSLFWVKHSFALAEKGYPIDQQDGLLLWVSGEKPVYTESLLFYCVYSNMPTVGKTTVNAGQRATQNWLFRRDTDQGGNVYEQLSANLRSLASHPTNPNYEEFVDVAIAPWFQTRCEELQIDLVAELREDIDPALDVTQQKEQERALAEGFSRAIGRLVREHRSLRSGKNLNVTSTTTDFARRVYTAATPTQRSRIGNTNLEITSDEAKALLEAVGRMEHGEHFLRSLLFVLYLDPLAHSQGEIEQQMRHLYDRVADGPQSIVKPVQERYHLSSIDNRVTDDLEATAFYWVLNFFMADGESIARELLENSPPFLATDDINDYFADHPEVAKQYNAFFNYTAGCRPYLSQLLAELRRENATSTVAFIERLIAGLDSEQDPAELFLGLLESQDTIEEKTAEQYMVTTRPSNTNAATFYGISALVSWATTLAEAV